ncbi:hypothetical protein J0X19_19515 [Hymenobacter sp. BT186]|uniref:Uncharacterized protein n=1 Tax=Hymenobacter telluris TaxID=2816474 RepID=A0A939JAS1_9BACT|nr:hypothetical protein [Hymenobacter telluris]MBO0360159.1 hypothetical protein [Hymenobacter telluris]MBW3376186.1 hypothetical protein [Hymenobacter norwichensis]
MQGVYITKKLLPSDSNSTADAINITIVVVVGLVLLPFLLLIGLGFWLKEILLPATAVPATADEWRVLNTGTTHLVLRYQFIAATEVSDEAAGYFDTQSLICYQANPHVTFFDGYFTDFQVERADGVFVQKIHFNSTLDTVLAMPLCFFSYRTQEAEELVDLKDYTLDAKGNPEDFLLTASGDEDELHIRLVSNPSLMKNRII